MNIKTYLAVGELAQAAAHYHGLTGPVQFTVCEPRDYSSICANIPNDEQRRRSIDRRHRRHSDRRLTTHGIYR